MNELKTLRSLPIPKGHPILGNLKQFKATDKHRILEDWVTECGELFKIRLLAKYFIVSADATLNHEILKQRPDAFRRFHKISEIMEEMGIQGVFNAEGDRWKTHRALTSEALNARNVQQFFPTLTEISGRLLRKWQAAAEQGTVLDVQQEMMRFTVDITTAIAFGYQMNTLEQGEDAIQQHLEKIFPMINSRITAPIPLWRFLPSAKDKELKAALQHIEETVHHFIAAARKRLADDPSRKESPVNFLEALLVEQERNKNFSDKEVYGNVFTMLLAGEDTTSNSLSWTLFYLTQHPEYVQKVREEALSVFPKTDMALTYDSLKLLKWTEAVVQEAMRLKPVTPSLYMQALQDVTVGNLEVKQGTTVMLQNKVPQTHEKHFTDAQRFMPERWLSGGCPVHSPGVMRAFGGGPRFCPGKTLAMNELLLTISMICRHFNLALTVPKEDVKEVFAFTMYPENCRVRLKSV